MNDKAKKDGIRAWTDILKVRMRRYAEQSREKKTTRFLRGLCLFGLALLLGQCALPFSVYPLGIALLCAATDSIPYLSLGLILARPSWLSLASCGLTLAVRFLGRVFVDLPDKLGSAAGALPLYEHLRGRIYAESLYLRMTASCVSVFFVSLVAILRGGFRYYDLFGALLAIAVAPVAVLLYSGLFSSDDPMRRFTKRAAPVALAVSVCFTLRESELLCALAAYLALMLVCQRNDLFGSLITAVACGACAGTAYIPVLLAAAVVAHCLMDKLASVAAVAASASGILSAFLVGGTALSYTVFLPFLGGATLFCGYQKIRKPPAPKAAMTGEDKLSHTWRALSELAGERGAQDLASEYAAVAAILEEARTQEDAHAEAPTLHAEAEFAFSAAEGVCGDAICTFRNTENGKFYALICDGMGAGKQAALVARAAASFMKKLLLAGAKERTALILLGNFLRFGIREETTTTVDLLTLDEYSGTGTVFKCGAAPTYIKRGSEISTLAAHTVPLGILREADVQVLPVSFADGDMAILCSDGVGDGESPAWLTEYLSQSAAAPREMARHIVKTAREQGSRDDLSALVVNIKSSSR